MKRPRSRAALGLQLLLMGAFIFLAVRVVVPAWLVLCLRAYVNPQVQVGSIRVRWPGKLELRGVVFPQQTELMGASIRRLEVWPVGLDWHSRSVKVHLRVEYPALRLTRLKGGGTLWPQVGTGVFRPGSGGLAQFFQDGDGAHWQVVIKQLELIEGGIDFLDQNPEPYFRGMLQHFYAVVAPAPAVYGVPALSVAARAQVVGYEGATAPLNCSGWFALPTGNLDTHCSLEPFPLSAFHPYYRHFGRFEIREYVMLLETTVDWSVRNGHKQRAFRLSLTDAHQGDISFRGRNIVDFKELTKRLEPAFKGDLLLMDAPREPSGHFPAVFMPGNAVAQRLVAQFLEHDRRMLNVRFFGWPLRIHLGPEGMTVPPAGKGEPSFIEEVLERLALPLPEKLQVPPAVPPVVGEKAVVPEAPTPAPGLPEVRPATTPAP